MKGLTPTSKDKSIQKWMTIFLAILDKADGKYMNQYWNRCSLCVTAATTEHADQFKYLSGTICSYCPLDKQYPRFDITYCRIGKAALEFADDKEWSDALRCIKIMFKAIQNTKLDPRFTREKP